MGSGASGLALYWNLLVWVNTCAPFRATDPEGRDALGLDYTSSAVVPLTAPRKPSRLTGKAISVPFALFTRVRGRGVLRSSALRRSQELAQRTFSEAKSAGLAPRGRSLPPPIVAPRSVCVPPRPVRSSRPRASREGGLGPRPRRLRRDRRAPRPVRRRNTPSPAIRCRRSPRGGGTSRPPPRS